MFCGTFLVDHWQMPSCGEVQCVSSRETLKSQSREYEGISKRSSQKVNRLDEGL